MSAFPTFLLSYFFLMALSLGHSASLQTKSRVITTVGSLKTPTKAISLFVPNVLMRVNDNPCLDVLSLSSSFSPQNILIPILWIHPDLSNSVSVEEIESLKNNIRSKVDDNAELQVINGDINVLKSFIKSLTTSASEEEEEVILAISESPPIEPMFTIVQSAIKEIEDMKMKMPNLNVKKVNDYRVINNDNNYNLNQMPISQLRFNKYENKLYFNLKSKVNKPMLRSLKSISASTLSDDNSKSKSKSNIHDNTLVGEDLALFYLREYIYSDGGDVTFNYRYGNAYVNEVAKNSPEHYTSLKRLGPINLINDASTDTNTNTNANSNSGSSGRAALIRNIWGGPASTHFFQGEVISGLLQPLISKGFLSPKFLIHANDIFSTVNNNKDINNNNNNNNNDRDDFKNIFVKPVTCRLTNEAIRKDWHMKLAASTIFMQNNNANGDNNDNVSKENGKTEKGWKVSYYYFNGYIVREGSMSTPSPSSSSPSPSSSSSSSSSLSSLSPKKPWIVLVHGFGGGIDQFSALGRELVEHFDVTAIDMLGFGHSEKPPLSYNQYFWRDQLLEHVKREAKKRNRNDVMFAGNSIGGFISAAAASVLSEDKESDLKCNGLVLINSAGRIIDGAGLTETKVEDLFKDYQGPPSEFLRIFGKGIFSLLQPNIAKTCEWLYPTNKLPVEKYLAADILRDSCDPGAPDVIASGGKLPTPEPMNDLFRKYKGKVLIAQGVLDPLNDARKRAQQFKQIRGDISVDLIEGGHCPMDECPEIVAASIINWAIKA